MPSFSEAAARYAEMIAPNRAPEDLGKVGAGLWGLAEFLRNANPEQVAELVEVLDVLIPYSDRAARDVAEEILDDV